MRCVALFIFVLFSLQSEGLAKASVVATVDISSQTMIVKRNGRVVHRWPVSTGRKPYRTPVGRYRPTRMHVYWESRKYYNSPMPHSIFFRGGYAIHGAGDIKRLGRPSSHGCVRLHPSHAKKLFYMVRKAGRSNKRIVIQR